MINHTQYIQSLIDEWGYKSFLEIGYGKGNNFKAITCKEKASVDPGAISGDENVWRLTSDEFFDQLDGRKKYDIIFIDGLHHADQVERDIINSYKHLRKGGVILVHDVWPTNEEMTRVPRETKQWTGDCFKVWDGLLKTYPELKTSLINDDFGIGAIEHTPDVKELLLDFVSNISFSDYRIKYGQ